MTKEFLNQLINTQKEIEDIEARIKDIKSKQETISDSVRGSSSDFPYVQHTYKIEGTKTSKRYKKLLKTYDKMLQNKRDKLIKLNKKFEYELNYIDDSELRMILRFKYIDSLTNNQIAQQMNKKSSSKDYTEDSVRMKIKRFLEKI